MRVYKTLSESMNATIRVGDILTMAEQAAETNRKLATTVLEKVGHGESETSALGAAAYFLEQERIYRYDIPNIIANILNQKTETKSQTEENPA